MEQPRPLTADIKTAPVVLDQAEMILLEIGTPIEETVHLAETACRQACQLEDDQCRFKLDAAQVAGTAVLKASCSECPNPGNTFDAVQAIKDFAQARLDAVEAVPFPAVSAKGKPAAAQRQEAERLQHSPEIEALKDLGIDELELGVRAHNVLKRAGCQSIFDVVAMTKQQLREIPNMGEKRAGEVIGALRERRLKLRQSEQYIAKQLRRSEILSKVDVDDALKMLAEERRAQAERPKSEDEASTQLSEQPSPEEQETNSIVKEALLSAMENLSYRERRIIEVRFGLDGEQPKARREIGSSFKISQERVRHIENQACKKLDNFFKR
jgi:RNA polymerase sigma factor (sigma-70 family)